MDSLSLSSNDSNVSCEQDEDLTTRLENVLRENKKLLESFRTVDEIEMSNLSDIAGDFHEDDLVEDRIHIDLNKQFTAMANSPIPTSSVKSVTRPQLTAEVKIVNTPPVSKWLSLNDDLRSRGFLTVPVITAEDNAIDGGRLLEVCSTLMAQLSRKSEQLQQSALNESINFQVRRSPAVSPRIDPAEAAKIRSLEKLVADQKQKLAALNHQAKQRELEYQRLQKTVERIADEEQRRLDKEKVVLEQIPASARSTQWLEILSGFQRKLESLEKDHSAGQRQLAELGRRLQDSEEAKAGLSKKLEIVGEPVAADCQIDELRRLLENERARLRRYEAESLAQAASAEAQGVKFRAQINAQQDEISRLQAELEQRPTARQFSEIRGALAAAKEELAVEEKKKWKKSDTRELIRRDRNVHEIGIAHVAPDAASEILMDACVALRLNNPAELPSALKTIAGKQLAKLEKHEEFFACLCREILKTEICDFEAAHAKLLQLRAAAAQRKDLEDISEKLVAVIKRHGNAVTSLKMVPELLEQLLAEQENRKTAESIFEAAEIAVAKNADDLMAKTLHHYMQVFGVKNIRLVIPSINLTFRRITELSNFQAAICSELEMDAKTVTPNRCFEELSRRFFQ